MRAEHIVHKRQSGAVAGTKTSRRDTVNNPAYGVMDCDVSAAFAGFAKSAGPNHPFTIDGAGWGAWELVARYGELDIDDAAFPLFANVALTARNAESWSLGLNWYLNQNLKLVTTYNETTFDGGAAAGADRETEKAILTRAQLSF